jgi:hypothetical protein
MIKKVYDFFGKKLLVNKDEEPRCEIDKCASCDKCLKCNENKPCAYSVDGLHKWIEYDSLTLTDTDINTEDDY